MTTDTDPNGRSKEPSPLDKLLAYERASILDAACAVSNLTGLNLTNSIHAARNVALTIGDVQYALFGGTSRRLLRPIGDNPAAQAIVNDLVRSLGIRPGTGYDLDTYYGQLIAYSWHDQGSAKGAHFMPIYRAFETSQAVFPEHAAAFGVIRRRLVHLEILATELEFLLKRFDPKEIPRLSDWYANKFEAFASQAAETIAQVGELHFAVGGNRRYIRFETALDDLAPLSPLFMSINATLELLLLMYLRNVIVHDFNNHVSVNGTEAEIQFSIVCRKNFGVLFEYLEQEIVSELRGTFVENQEITGKVYRVMVDSRFPYVTFKFPRSKSGSWSIQNARLEYEMTGQQFTQTTLNLLFHVCKTSMDLLLSKDR